MLTICETLIGLVVFLLIVQFLKLQWAHRRLPPGPTPFPILGSLWQLNFKVDHDSLNKMAEVHGNIFTLWLGHTPGVVLHGFQAVKDGLNTHPEEFSGRLETPVFKRLANGKGIMFSSGHTWKQQRRFGLMTLRNLGLGKKGLEHRIQEEALHVWLYLLHNRSLFELLPWLMHHLPGPQQKANSCCEFVRSFIRKEIRSHKERGIPDKPQDFIDFYLAQIAKFLKLQWAHRRLPPGPTPFPILGSLWQLNFKVDHDSLNKMAEVHGNIFTLWLGHTPGVVLHGFQAVKDGLNTHPEEFSGRLETPVFKRLANGKGIMFSSGHTWKQQRRFGLVTLRNLGLGKKGLEHRIQEEARHLVGYFETVKGKSLDPSVPIVHAVSNVICAVVFGHRFSLEDETFHQLIEAFDCILAFGNSFHFFLFELLPWLMHHLPGPQQKANSCCEFVRSFIRKEIRSHKERGIPDKPQDFIDFYLAQIAKAKDDPTSTYDEDNMNQSIFDLFLAGTETTTTTLRWALLYMMVYPDIQERVQKELDTVLGPSQLICYEDRKKLPYANAVIHEIQRYCSIVLIAIPRESGKDTTLQGFPIPKGTLILPNLDSVLFDPEKWESPRQFSPSRFLDKEGNFVSREAFLPFSTGSCVCLGEQLARSELFIFFANLLRAFKFTLPQGVKEISTKLVLGSTMQPQPYKLCVVPR